MVTLELQCKLEDENIEVTYLDIIKSCTNIPEELLEFIPQDQLDIICDDIIKFSTSTEKIPKSSKSTSAIGLVAWLMNKGHMNAQHYRMDFVRVIISEMSNEAERLSNDR